MAWLLLVLQPLMLLVSLLLVLLLVRVGASYDVTTGLPAPGHTPLAIRSDAGRQVLQATLPPTPPPPSGSEAPLGSCSNPVLLSDLPPNGQVTLTPGEANCTHMQRSWNMFWGVPWDAGYLLPASFSAYRLLTIDTCLPGVAGSVVGYPVHLTVTALASTSGLCALAEVRLRAGSCLAASPWGPLMIGLRRNHMP
ncbi:hypothetical protein V8C86DRAFT_2569553, partial [Haematococcus lacustris]